MDEKKIPFSSYQEFEEAVLESKKGLHDIVEQRLSAIFRQLYPDAFVKMESNFAVKGRADMVVHLKDKIVHIELIASKEMVNRDVKLLKRSRCDIQLVILMDDEIDDKVAYEYHDELDSRDILPDHFQRFKLSEVLVKDKEERFIERLKQALEPKIILEPRLIHITESEPNWVGRKEELTRLNQCYQAKEIKIVALVGWGGFGKTTIARKWYEMLSKNNIQPDGIFGWSFYKNRSQDAFLEASLDYLSQGNPEVRELRNAPARFAKLTEYLNKGRFLFILDGLEVIQEDRQSDKFGNLKDTSMQGFLQNWAGGEIRESFCLITTRVPMTDLKNWENKGYISINIEELKREDGIELFKRWKIKGEEDELGRLVEEYGSHALSLTLVAGFLNDFCNRDAKRAKEIPFYEMKDEENKALRILRAYDERLTNEQRIFLQIFSCFLRPIDDDAINQVFRKEIKLKDGTVFNESLVSMSEFEFKQMGHHLEERRLIYKGTTHPLIKNYFEKGLAKEARIAINRRLYHYIGSLAPEIPKSLEEMQPLFEQIYHGCKAGMYQEAYWDVYIEKVQRGDEGFLVKKLGAWETDLSLIQNFFSCGDFQKEPLVTEIGDKSYLLNGAGFSMRMLGRLKEAEGLYKKGIKIDISQEDWKNASVGYRNLAGLQIRTGNLTQAKEGSSEAIRLSKKAGNVGDECTSTAFLAYTLFLSGDMAKAGIEFEKASTFQRKVGPPARFLYSRIGIWYSDFLLSQGKIQEALDVTNENLRICERNNWIDIINLCHRSLASIFRHLKDFKEAEENATAALEGARKTGRQDIEAESLIELARIKLEQGQYLEAESTINQALRICQRSGYRLYESDAEVVLARAYLGLGEIDKAKDFANSAYTKAKGMGYQLARNEAEHLLSEMEKAI
ncbi:MAG: tetratricopeptide repeat protein [Nitrospirota bacterium]